MTPSLSASYSKKISIRKILELDSTVIYDEIDLE